MIGLIVFFAFVIVLAIVSRTNKVEGKTALEEFTEKNKTSSSEQEKMNEANKKAAEKKIFDEFKDTSYEFIYTINDNGKTVIYSGKKTTNKMVMDVIDNGATRYYQVGDTYLDSNFKQIDKIDLEYSKFINFDKLNKLYSYSTTGENGKRDLSAYDIFDIYYLDFTYDPFDIDDVEDSYMEITFADDMIKKVVLDFSKALSYMNQKDYTFTVTLEFSNIGKVEDITIG